MLLREGEGEGALEETLLDAVDPETSHVCSKFKSSSVVGPPSVLSKESKSNKLRCVVSSNAQTLE